MMHQGQHKNCKECDKYRKNQMGMERALTGTGLLEILADEQKADRWILSKLSRMDLAAPTPWVQPEPAVQRRKDLKIAGKPAPQRVA